MNIQYAFMAGASLLLLAACGPGKTTDEKASEQNTQEAVKKVELADAPASQDFPGATLTVKNVTATPVGNDSVRLKFDFGISNYELKAQTSDADAKMCANSAEGQHIHFILDNMPYKALYEPTHEEVVAKNSEHYLLTFLSRSYHESLKNKEAAVLTHFKVDANGQYQKLGEPSTPMLFYSRPKGDYIGKDTANLLLDFYPWNFQLDNSHSVKAVITNNTTGATGTFMINQWTPKLIKNLGAGQCTATISLVDNEGNPLTGPNTTVTRNFTLAAKEPM